MNHLLVFYLVSVVEWIALLSFPIILLGYHYQKYIKRITLIALIISLFSLLLRLTSLHLFVIIASQIIILIFLKKLFYKSNYLESLVLTGIGYGFYVFLHLLIAEVIISLSSYNYFELLFSNIKYFHQSITALLVLTICYLVHKNHYHLLEFRDNLKAQKHEKQFKTIIITISLLTFIFICLAAFTMLNDELNFRYPFVLSCIIVLFIILSIYLILHTQFQRKRLLEAKKFYLDQEQQVATIVEKLKKDYIGHFQALLKLCERNSAQLIKDYVEKRRLHIDSSFLSKGSFLANVESVDELLYAFLVNKRKLADLLGITLIVTADSQCDVPVSFKQIRYLSTIIDELLFLHYQASNDKEKELHFQIQKLEEGIRFQIVSDLIVSEEQSASLKLFDVMFQFEKDNATVQSVLSPVQLSIFCPLY
ncbi:hypothetical protein J2S00_002885 [Caldalkalibacillus uzonensis]|uniref:Uncharacterized protein n=1 Tax=Caldalkalibacillus uzonensis TaxID=353224 RepID=A0ABU0CUI4_9BACI|nr:hypothetical protein [Caldalkalibacillus uzonensis]MDQ0340090.1 hypothetical protein [Caldalkalibacillus uzonensis]